MRRLSLLAACAALALTPTAAVGAASSGTWHGKLEKYTSKLTFQVHGNKLVKFTVQDAPEYCFSGIVATTVYVPKASIHGNKISGTEKVTAGGGTQTIKLTGTISGRKAKGSVTAKGGCDTSFTWSAHR